VADRKGCSRQIQVVTEDQVSGRLSAVVACMKVRSDAPAKDARVKSDRYSNDIPTTTSATSPTIERRSRDFKDI